MNKRIYINATACISPQNTFLNRDNFSINTPNQGLLKCIEPDYKKFIEPKDIRRINRLQKMGISAAIQCLKDANIQMPDAIIVATGWGCIDSTYQFLNRMYNQQNLPVNPSAFIQSTHNTIAAQIAMRLPCRNYNNTITDNELPFELALDDAIICIHEDNLSEILLGSADELTPQLADILGKIAHPQTSIIVGEGSAFFSLSTTANKNSIEIKHFQIGSKKNIVSNIKQLVSDYNIGTIFTDTKDITSLSNFSDIILNYNTLCGNYPTNTGFGLWLATEWLQNGTIFDISACNTDNIMLYKESKNGLCSVIIVGK